MNIREVPIVFDCEGDELVGVLHIPEQIRARGLLSIVAGGPQYRAGVGRLQVQLARELAAHGVPVMRFDYRGLGDSAGQFRGFQDVAADLAAALAEFRKQVPALSEFVLWGGCDAASAVLINAWRFPEVTGIVAGNPFARTEGSANAAVVKHHYRKRIRDKDFWLKVLRLQYNPFPAMGTLCAAGWQRLTRGGQAGADLAEENFIDDPTKPFVPRMRMGLSRFKGDVLFLMSGRSLVTKEFDELVAARPAWQQAMKAPRHVVRYDMPDADQTYSSIASRVEVIEAARRWMLDPHGALR